MLLILGKTKSNKILEIKLKSLYHLLALPLAAEGTFGLNEIHTCCEQALWIVYSQIR